MSAFISSTISSHLEVVPHDVQPVLGLEGGLLGGHDHAEISLAQNIGCVETDVLPHGELAFNCLPPQILFDPPASESS
jgi:hypothetical protein